MHDGLLDIVEHPNKSKYPSQGIFIINIDDYVYLVPFVEDNEIVFLKTIIPSRKIQKSIWEKNMKMSKEEESILESLEKGEWKSVRPKGK